MDRTHQKEISEIKRTQVWSWGNLAPLNRSVDQYDRRDVLPEDIEAL